MRFVNSLSRLCLGSYFLIEEQLFALLHPEHPEQQPEPFFFRFFMINIIPTTIIATVEIIIISAVFIITSYMNNDPI